MRCWLRIPAGMRAPWQLFPLRTGRRLVVPVRSPSGARLGLGRGSHSWQTLPYLLIFPRRWKGDSHINNFFDDARERFKPTANPHLFPPTCHPPPPTPPHPPPPLTSHLPPLTSHLSPLTSHLSSPTSHL